MSLCNCRPGINRCFFRWGAAIAISQATSRGPEYASARILCLLGDRQRIEFVVLVAGSGPGLDASE
jgi:hypothetical protein